MERKATKKFIVILFVAAALLIAAAAVIPLGAALGWFQSSKSHEQIAPVTPFQAKTIVRFEGKTAPESSTLVPVNLTNPDHENYIGKLRVSVAYSGEVEAMMRVHITHFWEQNGASPSRANVKFRYDGGLFLDNTVADGCYYYCRTADYAASGADAFVLPTTRETATLDFITGIDQQIIYESSLSLTLMIQTELIQSNRYNEFWGGLPAPV